MHSYTVTGSFTHDGAQRTITVHHCRDNDHAQEVAETYWLHKGHGTPHSVSIQRKVKSNAQ